MPRAERRARWSAQARTVRVFAQEGAEVERFDGLLAATYRLASRAAWLQGVTDGARARRLAFAALGLHPLKPRGPKPRAHASVFYDCRRGP